MTADERDDPAAALGDIWEALDSLPRSVPSPAVTATTIEMVAISAQHRSAIAARPSPQAWVAAAALVVAGFVGGAAAGRATSPGPTSRFLQQAWPFVEHLDLLQEAGSVEFLHEVDRRAYPPPRSFPFLQQPAGEDPAFEAALEALRTGGATRERSAGSSGEQGRELEDRMREVTRLEGSDRRRLGELARALANPENEHLVEAARLWHAWVASRDPAERRTIISLETDERLEWLDRYSRLQSRMPSRPFNDQGRPPRRGPPPRGENPAPPR
jgi:hypothetical protein